MQKIFTFNKSCKELLSNQIKKRLLFTMREVLNWNTILAVLVRRRCIVSCLSTSLLNPTFVAQGFSIRWGTPLRGLRLATKRTSSRPWLVFGSVTTAFFVASSRGGSWSHLISVLGCGSCSSLLCVWGEFRLYILDIVWRICQIPFNNRSIRYIRHDRANRVAFRLSPTWKYNKITVSGQKIAWCMQTRFTIHA